MNTNITIIAILTFFVAIFAMGWYSNVRVAAIYNAQNGAHYSASDFFWAGDQINAQTQTINLKTN